MTTNKNEPFKIPCDGLNRILTVKKLSKKEINSVVKRLKTIVKSNKPGKNQDMFSYIKVVIASTLDDNEQNFIANICSQFDLKEPENVVIVQNLITSVYISVIELYPMFSLHWVCSDLNNIMPPMAMDDSEFEKILEKETTPKKNKKKQFEFSTLKHIKELETFLSKNVIGQDQAVKAVCEAVKLKAVGFAKTLNLFFIGKTGRGKSELAKLLGQQYSGNFWMLNCAEFSNGHEVNRLLGAPPGYIGHSEKSIICEKSEKSNKWVIVFDEIEKAHPKFYNFLLALMETGICYDNIGKKVDLSDSIFIFTSNCGLKEIKTKSTNFHLTSNKESTKESIQASIENEFSPEFRNRIDEWVFFNDLTKEDCRKIAALRLKEYPLKITPQILDFVVENGFSEEFGARGLGRYIKKVIALPLADTILSSKKPADGTRTYDLVVNSNKVEVVNIQ